MVTDGTDIPMIMPQRTRRPRRAGAAGRGACSDAGLRVRRRGTGLGSPGLSPSDINHVNAHATSTQLGDHQVATAPKGGLGHLIGASGAVEAIATMLSIRERVAPPMVNLDNQAVFQRGDEDSSGTLGNRGIVGQRLSLRKGRTLPV